MNVLGCGFVVSWFCIYRWIRGGEEFCCCIHSDSYHSCIFLGLKAVLLKISPCRIFFFSHHSKPSKTKPKRSRLVDDEASRSLLHQSDQGKTLADFLSRCTRATYIKYHSLSPIVHIYFLSISPVFIKHYRIKIQDLLLV